MPTRAAVGRSGASSATAPARTQRPRVNSGNRTAQQNQCHRPWPLTHRSCRTPQPQTAVGVAGAGACRVGGCGVAGSGAAYPLSGMPGSLARD
jgi:hypothetical protein